nr:xylulose kinase-like [Chlorocebus sabaeus]
MLPDCLGSPWTITDAELWVTLTVEGPSLLDSSFQNKAVPTSQPDLSSSSWKSQHRWVRVSPTELVSATGVHSWGLESRSKGCRSDGWNGKLAGGHPSTLKAIPWPKPTADLGTIKTPETLL